MESSRKVGFIAFEGKKATALDQVNKMEAECAKGKECDEIEQLAQPRAYRTRKLAQIWAFWRARSPENQKILL